VRRTHALVAQIARERPGPAEKRGPRPTRPRPWRRPRPRAAGVRLPARQRRRPPTSELRFGVEELGLATYELGLIERELVVCLLRWSRGPGSSLSRSSALLVRLAVPLAIERLAGAVVLLSCAWLQPGGVLRRHAEPDVQVAVVPWPWTHAGNGAIHVSDHFH